RCLRSGAAAAGSSLSQDGQRHPDAPCGLCHAGDDGALLQRRAGGGARLRARCADPRCQSRGPQVTDRIRLGFVGANLEAYWAKLAHVPALLASPDVEIAAVCTRRPESAEAARQALRAKHAFTDYRALAASPDVDAVLVSVNVPSHYGPARAA